jgi:hypothetical protein
LPTWLKSSKFLLKHDPPDPCDKLRSVFRQVPATATVPHAASVH